MRILVRSAVVLAAALAVSACGGSHRVISAKSVPPHSPTTPLMKRLAVEARDQATSLGDPSVKTAQVYGPDSRYLLVKASSGDVVQKIAAERTGFYLIVLHGRFVCRGCTAPLAGAKPGRGRIATEVWSPKTGQTDFGIGNEPVAMARLHGPTVIGLGEPSVKAIAAERERAAVRKAEQVLRRFAARTGALPIPGRIVPTALDNVSLGVSIENMFAARHEFWRLPEPLQAAIAFVKRHPLRGFDWSHPVEGYGANSPVTLEFDGLLAGDVPMQRVLTVTFVPFRGATALRVDAQAAWIYPRSPREVVPKGARKIDIRYPRRKEVNIRKVSPADIDSPLVTRQVTDPAKVARIIRWFDALNVVQPGPVVNCMAIITTTATFMFRSASGAELASATVPSQPANGCDAINFFVGGKQQPSLIDSTPRQGMAFVDRVQRLLGVRLGPRIVAR